MNNQLAISQITTALNLSADDIPFTRAQHLFLICGIEVGGEMTKQLETAEKVMKAYRDLDLAAQAVKIKELEEDIDACDDILQGL